VEKTKAASSQKQYANESSIWLVDEDLPDETELFSLRETPETIKLT
jgi:hypothetical protein